MTSGLEYKIIAYFDGELSDADSAELLHLTSVSPEVRDLFREHEMLRDLAHEATRSVMVSPEIESSLFARIEALSEAPVKEKAVLIFSRRAAILAALALIFISGSLGYFVPKFFSGNSEPQIGKQITAKNAIPTILSSINNSLAEAAQSAPANILVSKPAKKNLNPALADAHFNNPTSIVASTLTRSLPNENKSNPSEIHPVDLRSDDIHSTIGGEKLSPLDILSSPESRSLFELSLQTSSGFTYPANAAPIAPFADQRLSLAYHFTENNLIGFRLGSGLYQQLSNVAASKENGVEILTRSIETKRSFSEELYFSHLVPIYFFAPLTLEFSLDGGFIPNGYSLGAEAGVRIPFSENWIMGIDFALSRIHSNAIASNAILASQNTGTPVILEAIDIHNTLNGRLHYGLLYRF